MLCGKCGSETVIYGQINGNGAHVVVERCPKCGRNPHPGKPFLPIKDYKWETLPLIEDRTKNSEPCAVKGCERTDTEYHHFAPRHIFGLACDDWPGAWICMKHHREWHMKTKTGSYAPKLQPSFARRTA
jgi:hypothetical protein